MSSPFSTQTTQTVQTASPAGAQAEALAGLRLVALIAMADGATSEEEREILAEALDGSDVPIGVSSKSLLDEHHDLEALLRAVTSQDGRDVAFGACFAIAHANRRCLPAEQALLDRIAEAWAVPEETRSVLDRVVEEAQKTIWIGAGDPIADPRLRAAEVQKDIVKYSVIAAVLGLNPIPIASIATDFAVVGLQVKMFSDIGRHWGHASSNETAAQVVAGLGVGTGVRLAANALVRFVPGAGSGFAAATNFASTWAVGQVANQYWESGGKADAKMLRELFATSLSNGRREFEKHQSTIEARRMAHSATLDALAADYAAGKLTLSEYQAQAAELR